jgi:hypothetical protein
MKRFCAVMLVVTLCLAGTASGDIITQWTFQDADDVGTDSPSIGSGTIGTIGGASQSGFTSGFGSSDPFQSGKAYQTGSYPAQGTASGTAGIEVNVSTSGYRDIVVSFDQRPSNTASRWHQFEYTMNGATWTALDPLEFAAEGQSKFYNGLTYDLSSVSEVDDNASFAFRVVSVFSPLAFDDFGPNEAYQGVASPYSSNGTWRFDMVTVSGVEVPEPSSVVLFVSALLMGACVVARRRVRN